MRFLFPSTVAVTVLIAIGAIGSKAEAAMRPSIGTPPAHTKNYTPVEPVGWRRYYRRGYYGYGYPYYGYGYARPYYGYGYARPYYGYGYRPYGYYGHGRRWGY